MTKARWFSYLGGKKIEAIDCLDSGSQRVWIKFEPVDKSNPMEVCNIVDQPTKVSWEYKNSHFETIDELGKSNYYEASSAGSFPLNAGTTNILKSSGAKVIVFPLNKGVSLDVYKYSLAGDQFAISVDKPTWVAYVVSGSGTVNPI